MTSSWRPSDAYMHVWSQVKPVLGYYQLSSILLLVTNIDDISRKIKQFSQEKMGIWKCRLKNDGRFVSVVILLTVGSLAPSQSYDFSRIKPFNFMCIWRIMKTSSNGNLFRVTGPLWGEFTGHRWIPLIKASDAELWCLIWSAHEQTVEQIIAAPDFSCYQVSPNLMKNSLKCW